MRNGLDGQNNTAVFLRKNEYSGSVDLAIIIAIYKPFSAERKRIYIIIYAKTKQIETGLNENNSVKKK